jgi:hypothetical protein
LQIFNDKKPWNVVQSSKVSTTSRANTSNQIGRIVNLLSNHALPTDAPRRIIVKLLAHPIALTSPNIAPVQDSIGKAAVARAHLVSSGGSESGIGACVAVD